LTVEQVPIDRLRPAPWNPRSVRDERFAQLCRSLEADPAFLEQRPILAQADGTVFAGNHRLLAAKHLGWVTVPAIIADVPDDVAKRRAMIDNNNAADWADDDLGALLASLGDSGTDLTLLGFEDGELERLLGQAPEGVEFKEYDESAAEEVAWLECPE
jgi:ParB-like chromosome segregation protein Spo0J